ncbi:hypothetical protein I6F03_08180, partial [Staphylococcus aureus]|nr:hypothetical protein [Staphylococcus aureus]
FYDLTREGATDLNRQTSLNPNIVYKTYTGEATHKALNSDRQIGTPISTGNASWGVGRRNKFCENIISVPLPSVFFSLNVQLEYMYNNIKHAVKRSQSIQTDFAHRVFLT